MTSKTEKHLQMNLLEHHKNEKSSHINEFVLILKSQMLSGTTSLKLI